MAEAAAKAAMGLENNTPAGFSSTPSAYVSPDPLWDRVQVPSNATAAARSLPPGLVSVRWGAAEAAACPDVSPMSRAIAALQRDGAFVLEGGMPAGACDAVRAQMAPYVEASAMTTDGGRTRRPAAVLSRSRASWSFAAHPFVRKLCEGVLGRQALQSTAEEVEAQLFADRRFKQHPYNLDISMLICVEPGGKSQDLHLDAGKHVMDFRPFGLETTISTMWAIEDFSASNGATSLCLGSRHWPPDRRGRHPRRDAPRQLPLLHRGHLARLWAQHLAVAPLGAEYRLQRGLAAAGGEPVPLGAAGDSPADAR